jgi:hypothetical protein
MKYAKVLSLCGVLVLTAAITFMVLSANRTISNTSSYLKTGVSTQSNGVISFYGTGATFTGSNMPGVPNFIAESEKTPLTSTSNIRDTRFLITESLSSNLSQNYKPAKMNNQMADAMITEFLHRAANTEVLITTNSTPDYTCGGGTFYN